VKEVSEYDRGGRPVTPVNLLLLISELEGSSQHLKYMGFNDDEETINEIKKRFYKLYFELKRSLRQTQV
jgi:hypothetical protein